MAIVIPVFHFVIPAALSTRTSSGAESPLSSFLDLLLIRFHDFLHEILVHS